jgi:hypothetical protein
MLAADAMIAVKLLGAVAVCGYRISNSYLPLLDGKPRVHTHPMRMLCSATGCAQSAMEHQGDNILSPPQLAYDASLKVCF